MPKPTKKAVWVIAASFLILLGAAFVSLQTCASTVAGGPQTCSCQGWHTALPWQPTTQVCLGKITQQSCQGYPGGPNVNCTALADLPATPIVYTYENLNRYPHDPTLYTQGLLFANGFFYESAGLYGQSSLRKVDSQTGEVVAFTNLETQYFAEGLALVDDRLFQITWRENTGFVYAKDTLELIQTFSYPTEGWGLTYDGESLVMSDGTANLFFLDPQTFAITHSVVVHTSHGPVEKLNELEYVEGAIYANIWKTDRIAQIDPGTGRVIGSIHLEGILPDSQKGGPEDVLNGIAHDPATGRLWVTGKRWPVLFEIQIKPESTP